MTALYLITFSGLSLAQPEPEQITLLDKKATTKESKKVLTKEVIKFQPLVFILKEEDYKTSDPISGDLIGYQLDV